MDKRKLLKSARELIDKKEFREALEKCKEVLAETPDYMALLFSGLCSAEVGKSKESEKYYLDATKLDERKPQALQGLFKLYEAGKVENFEQFLICCRRLIELVSDPMKQSEYKQSELRCLLRLNLLHQVISFLESNRQSSNHRITVNSLCQKSDLDSVGVELIRNSIDLLLLEEPDDKELVEKRLQLELQFGSCRQWLEFSLRLTDEFSKNVSVVALGLIFIATGDNSIAATEIPDDFWPLKFLESVVDGDWSVAYQYLTDHSDENTESPNIRRNPIGFLLCSLSIPIYLHFHQYQNAEESTRRTLKAISELKGDHSDVIAGLQLKLVQSLLGSGLRLGEAEKLLLQLEENKFSPEEVSILSVYFYNSLNQLDKAYQTLSKISHQNYRYFSALAWIQMSENKLDLAKENALSALQLNDTVAWNHFVLGKVLSAQGRTDGAILKEFLQSAKLDPYHAESFYQLGLYYAKITNDLSKASRCLERAVNLDKTNEQYGVSLSDVYREIGENVKEKHVNLLRQIVQNSPLDQLIWARLRLGLELVANGDTEQAIEVLQTLTRSDPESARAWECIGDAYRSRGSLESAEKCFEKVVELDANSRYAALQAASIQLERENYSSSIEICTKLLNSENDYLPGLVLLGEGHLKWAQKLWQNARYYRAMDQVKLAIATASKVCQLDEKLVSGWKILADSFILLSNFDPDLIKNLHLSVFSDGFFVSKLSILELAAKFYLNAIKCCHKYGSLWYDLGLCLFFQAQLTETESQKSKLAQHSEKALKRSLSLDAITEKSRCWITIGLLYTKIHRKPTVAQHCFIRAVTIDQHSALGWSCLGLLYLSHENMQLANKCFTMAQSADPNYAVAWCGQALLAQNVGSDEAMDLMRHTTQLANLRIAVCSYGYDVIKKLKERYEQTNSSKEFIYELDAFHAIPTARDALEKYYCLSPKDKEVVHLVSILSELELLNIRALEYAKSALILNADSAERAQICRANLARLEGKLSHMDLMRKHFAKLPKSDLDLVCSRALVQAESGDWQAALQSFSDAIFGTENEHQSLSVELSSAICAIMAEQYEKANEKLSLISSRNLSHLACAIVSLLNCVKQGNCQMDQIKSHFLTLISMDAELKWFEMALIIVATHSSMVTNVDLLASWLVHQFPSLSMTWTVCMLLLPGRFEKATVAQTTTKCKKLLMLSMCQMKEKQKTAMLKVLHEYRGELSSDQFILIRNILMN